MGIIAGDGKSNKNRQDPHDFNAVVVNGFNVCKLSLVCTGAHFTKGQNWGNELFNVRAESSRRTRDINGLSNIRMHYIPLNAHRKDRNFLQAL